MIISGLFRIKVKNALVLFYVICALLSTVVPAPVGFGVYVIMVGSFFVISIVKFDLAVELSVLLLPMALIIRFSMPENILMAGFRTELVLILLFFGLVFRLYQKSLLRMDVMLLGFVILLIVYLIILSFTRYDLLSIVMLVFREQLLPLFLLIIFYFYVNGDKHKLVNLMDMLFISSAVVGFVTILSYATILDSPFSPYSMNPLTRGNIESGNLIATRQVFGFHIPRMSLLTGGSVGGGGLFMSIMLVYSWLRVTYLKEVPKCTNKYTWFMLTGIVAMSCLLAVSFSSYLYFLIVFFILILKFFGRLSFFIFFPMIIIMPILMGYVEIGVDVGRKLTLLEYIINTSSKFTDYFAQYTLTEHMIGYGFDVKSSAAGLRDMPRDLGIMSVYASLGIVGTGLYLAIFAIMFAKFRKPVFQGYRLPIVLILIGSLLLLHGSPFVTRPFDVLIAIYIAWIFSVSNSTSLFRPIVLGPDKSMISELNDCDRPPSHVKTN
jgi:hypothetical protein